MAGVVVMADDPYARIAQLETENAALGEREAAGQTREAALVARTERAEADLADALGQQVATAGVLRIIRV